MRVVPMSTTSSNKTRLERPCAQEKRGVNKTKRQENKTKKKKKKGDKYG